MTPEAQNKAIAGACGLKQHADGIGCYKGKHPLIMGGKPWPNYYGDLNACHAMEKVLTKDQMIKYIHSHLRKAVGGHSRVTATAPQRCEAFLKTLNLWKE